MTCVFHSIMNLIKTKVVLVRGFALLLVGEAGGGLPELGAMLAEVMGVSLFPAPASSIQRARGAIRESFGGKIRR